MNKLKTINIKGKEYVMVNERIREFNELYKNGRIITEIIRQDENTILMKTIITPDISNLDRYFTGHAHEDKQDKRSIVNSTSHIENCETSAIGRALAMMGIGILDSIASADEVINAINKQPKQDDMTIPIIGAEVELDNNQRMIIPACSICDSPMKKNSYGWYCYTNWKDHKAKELKPTPIWPDKEISQEDKDFLGI